jgi:predicted glycoside hydrolase/deacetylase ChbG (UPF0249 family)
MRLPSALFVLAMTAACSAFSQPASLPERLGYPKGTKLLIVHADDLGVAHSENKASTAAFDRGMVNSASIMVPTPWFAEIASYARANPKADLGLHLTLTSEWKYYKWGPVSGRQKGLQNAQGYMFESVDSVYMSASLTEVETELRGQISKAQNAGIDITHLDSHMGTLFGRPDYLKLMITLGRELKVPVMLFKNGPGSVSFHKLESFLASNDIVADTVVTANPDNFRKGMAEYYSSVLNALKPGLTVLLIHTAYDDEEMQAITVDHPDWGATWRQADYNFFTSDRCKSILQQQKIQLVTWREIRDKLSRK